MNILRSGRIFLILNIIVATLFLLLTFKDPFSQRTLIPNFEPYPDTFHYINPALSLLKGTGFNLVRENRILKSHVSPLYSISLIPLFLLRPDPRMAYYSNVILAFLSLFLFWKILWVVIKNNMIILLLLILYVTNYFIYWVPSLIMAENLTLTLYLASVYFLISKISKVNLFILSLIAMGGYAAKYSNIPMTVLIILVALTKTFLTKQNFREKIILSLFLLTPLVIAGLMDTKISSQINNTVYYIQRSFMNVHINNEGVTKLGTSYTSSWFGIEFIGKNFPAYMKSLMGESNRFLWDSTPILPKLVAIGGLLGIIVGFFIKKFRFISVTLLVFIFSMVIFMSTFYSFDARYIYIAIPSLIIGFGLFLTFIESKIPNKKITFSVLILAFICIYLMSNFIRIKSQISLNLRYAETPWNYIAVLKMNEYFTSEKTIDGKKPVLISALPPFLIDYYSNRNYTLLPLSYEQEFRGIKETVWGPNDYSDLPKLYEKYLVGGYDLYVSRAGLGNEGYTNRDFDTIIKEFDTELVISGCFDQCNIYSVKLKNEKL